MDATTPWMIDMRRRAVVLRFTLPPGTTSHQVNLSYRGFWDWFPSVGAFTIQRDPNHPVSVVKVDLCPPLDRPFQYWVSLDATEEWTQPDGSPLFPAFTVPSGGYAWVRTDGSPEITTGLLLEGTPTLKSVAEGSLFYPGSAYGEGRAVGISLPRRRPTVTASFLTLSASEALRFRVLLALNPLLFQWPADAQMPDASEWYHVGDVEESAVGPANPARRWQMELTPVVPPSARWSEVDPPRYYWAADPFGFADYGEARASGLTYGQALDVAYQHSAPPLPDLEV